MNSIDENDRAIQEKISKIFDCLLIEHMIIFQNLKSNKDDGSLEKWTRWTKVGSLLISRHVIGCALDHIMTSLWITIYDVMMRSSWRNNWTQIRRKEQINKQEKEAGVKYVKTLVEKHNSQKVGSKYPFLIGHSKTNFHWSKLAIFDPKWRHNWKRK